MKVSHLLIAASAAFCLPAAAFAQEAPAAAAAPNLAVGGTIYDAQGEEVGTIDSIADTTVVVNTGTNKAALPKTSIGSGPKGPMVSITKAQIDEQVAAAAGKAAAALDAALVAGAEVKGKAGTPVGTIKEVKGDLIVLDRTGGAVSLPKKAFGMGPQGLYIGMTAAELDAAAKKALGK
ncbi:hypothetical protein [Novosphingobium sp. KACC 22771]|uniref:hypothetical protein n=1 Tax=Novosphingobium sp. KACC 22771 TaxID=3025670 RepID=UPI00236612A4|nr:hypothetical protein [Novosphingobium sp. KACC 22771]WDF75148.1 hypothetical protein PQ467_19205 [Novosphingobium sp. KACC 22771]